MRRIPLPDGHVIDLTAADAYAGPEGRGLHVNAYAVFGRVDGRPWRRLDYRSEVRAARDVAAYDTVERVEVLTFRVPP